MHKTTKKWLSVILSITLLFSICGAPAFAAESEEDAVEEIIEVEQTPEEEPETDQTDDGGIILMSVEAEEGVVDYLQYEENHGEITITGCDTAIAGVVEIPAEIGDLPVTVIGSNAFRNCSNMTSVAVPDSVLTIGYGAFQGCSGLTEMTIPFVGNNASGTNNCHFGYLFGCSYSAHLSSLPSSLKTVTVTGGAILGDYAFVDCQYLTTVILPDSLTKIGDKAFGYYSSNGGCKSLKSITIPSGVTSIGVSAFSDSGLTSITIPDSVNTIGARAFQNCTSLTRVTLSGGLTSISQEAFSGCSSLISVSFPEGIRSIGQGAFGYCRSLTRLNIPGTVTTIDSSAFYGCTGITRVTMNEGLKSINSSAFNGCSGLIKADIPESVIQIGQNAFSGCGALTIYGCEGSVAESYANENGIPFTVQSTAEPTAAPTATPTAMPTEAPVVPENAPKITISDIKTMPGKEIEVTVALSQNTGFASLGIEVGYNKAVMTLTGVTADPGVGATFTPAQSCSVNPYNMAWDSVSNITYNGNLATLTFTVGNNVPDGIYPITVDYYKGVNGNYVDGVNVNYDEDFEAVGFVYVSGNVIVRYYIPGDINGDESVDNKDATFLLRYLAGWSLSNIVEDALDIDGSSAVDNKDATILLRYLAGWNVTLH